MPENQITTASAPEPGYWAVIPARIRYASDLPAGAKLLYAEISSLTDQRGYCYASNAYFCRLYEISEPTVQRYLKALRAGGYISIIDGDGGASRRKIYAGINPLSENPVKNEGVPDNPVKNEGGTPSEMTPPPLKNETQNKKENKKENRIPPVSPRRTAEPLPPELQARAEHYAGDDRRLRQAILDFAEQRKKQRKPIQTHRALSLLLNRLDELSGGDAETKAAMLDNATMRGWQTVYALKDDERPQSARAPARTVEAPEGVARW